MKFRYLVITHVDAENIADAIAQAKKLPPHEVVFSDKVFEKRDFALKEEDRPAAGFKTPTK